MLLSMGLMWPQQWPSVIIIIITVSFKTKLKHDTDFACLRYPRRAFHSSRAANSKGTATLVTSSALGATSRALLDDLRPRSAS